MFARVPKDGGIRFLTEIVMIVIGISIALWFEGWFENRQDRETEREYLAGLRNDLQVDIQQLDHLIESSRAKVERLAGIIPELQELPQASPEAQAAALFEPSSYEFFQASDFTYRSMQESGDFRLLQDAETKKSIIHLARRYRVIDTLQANYLQALDDEYIPLLMRSFDIVAGRITDPALTAGPLLGNVFAFALQETQGRVAAYESARSEASSLLEGIQRQLGEP